MHAFQVDGATAHFCLAYLNYNLSELMIRQLRGDRINDRSHREALGFHGAFHFFGGPPILLVRTYKE